MPHPTRRAKIADREFFHDYVRRAFLHRRKLLRGVLRGMYRAELAKVDVDRVLSDLELAGTCRAEELDVATHVEISNTLWRAIHADVPAAV